MTYSASTEITPGVPRPSLQLSKFLVRDSIFPPSISSPIASNIWAHGDVRPPMDRGARASRVWISASRRNELGGTPSPVRQRHALPGEGHSLSPLQMAADCRHPENREGERPREPKLIKSEILNPKSEMKSNTTQECEERKGKASAHRLPLHFGEHTRPACPFRRPAEMYSATRQVPHAKAF